MMKQLDWGMGTSCYKANMAATSSGLKKKLVHLMILSFISSIAIVFLN